MISEALKLLRTYHNVSQQKLADMFGIYPSFISDLENGKKSPSMEMLGRYAKVFSIPISSIFLTAENLNKETVESTGHHHAQKLISWKQDALFKAEFEETKESPSRDWHDFDKGMELRNCSICNQSFYGHNGRTTCRVCKTTETKRKAKLKAIEAGRNGR